MKAPASQSALVFDDALLVQQAIFGESLICLGLPGASEHCLEEQKNGFMKEAVFMRNALLGWIAVSRTSKA